MYIKSKFSNGHFKCNILGMVELSLVDLLSKHALYIISVFLL